MDIQVGKNYKMRNGMGVRIVEHNPNSTACMRGYHEHETPSGRIKEKWNIWCSDGKFKFVGDSEYDIVSEV